MHSCFDLVFACFCFVTLHQVILTFPRLESNPERVWLWRHVTKPSAHTNTFSIPHKYKHSLPQYCGQFCIFPCSIAPFPHRSLFLGYFNRTSFGFLVSGSLLHVTTYSSSVGRNLVLDRFFHFIVPIFPDFPSLARNHANFEHSSVEEFFLLRLLLKTFPNGNNNNKNTALLNHVSYCMVLV
uniref:(northern house mosquito) hypothetical protein n=1 Tax=Culex pipiens TaxID=7175 RepID=A0A8D8ARQ4_CULPI